MSEAIESLAAEGRTFPPSEAFKRAACITDAEIYDEANADIEGFWARQATDLIDWFEPWSTVCDWDLPFAKWFVGAKLNASYNCLDRHVANGHGGKVAYHWEGEPGDTRTITYAELLDEVSRLANALKELGVKKGDRVNIYMGMVPELPMALLACSRIGAPHSVVF
ncbi:MAG: AMP-binding protein, partial [Acidimicrobiia bacterium]|nr:AMP-binding protein [Acidimicrobiia bacterium]